MPGRKFPAIPGGRHKDAGCNPLWVAAVNSNVQGDGNVWIPTGIYAGDAGTECTTGSIGDAMNSRLYTALRRDGNILRMSWIIAGIGRNLEFMVMQWPYLIIKNGDHANGRHNNMCINVDVWKVINSQRKWFVQKTELRQLYSIVITYSYSLPAVHLASLCIR